MAASAVLRCSSSSRCSCELASSFWLQCSLHSRAGQWTQVGLCRNDLRRQYSCCSSLGGECRRSVRTFLSSLVSVYASSHSMNGLIASRERDASRRKKKEALIAMGREGGIRARRVRVAKERLHARRFFVRQTQFGPHWGSRQSTQYQFSAGTARMPSHLTWHVFCESSSELRRVTGSSYQP